MELQLGLAGQVLQESSQVFHEVLADDLLLDGAPGDALLDNEGYYVELDHHPLWAELHV